MEGKENQNITAMQLLLKFFDQVQKQGLSITLLVIASFFVIQQNSELQGKVDSCMQLRIDDMNKNRFEFLEVMGEVKTALRENTRALRSKTGD